MKHRSAPRRPLGFRTRLSLFAVGALCIAAAVGVFYALWTQQTTALRMTELERQVGVIGSGVAVGEVLPGSVEDTGQERARLLKVEAGLIGARLSVADGRGAVLYSTAGASAPASYPIASLSSPRTQFEARSGVFESPGVGAVVVAAVPVSFAGPDQPRRFLVGAKALSDLSGADTLVSASIAVAALVALVVAGVLGTWLASRITGPLTRLTDGALAVAAGEWGRQVPVEGDDEVAGLARAFNDMSVRVADAYRAQQEFVGDVSHEIRTPVTSIRGFAEAISDGTLEGEEGVQRAAGIIRAEADRLTDLTSTLLALADLDAGTVELAQVPVDVRALAGTLRTRFDARAVEDRVDLQIDLGAARPRADPDRLLQALSALVDNALRHAPEGGHVRVGARAEGRWLVAVEDDGPGITPEERERVFGRFTRLDSSRSTSSGGSGLGLAISRRIVELMGGRIGVDTSADLGGARFTIELPMS